MKKRFFKYIISFLFAIVFTKNSSAQIQHFNMSDMTTYECRGFFHDDGYPLTQYLSVPSTTVTKVFSIHGTPGVPITMTFSPAFCQIQAQDNITFFNGPTIAFPVIVGPITSTNSLPTVVAPSGSLTIRWVENGNTVGFGWDGGWFSSSVPPLPPTATITPAPSCFANQITLTTNHGVICDSLKPNYFIINGPMTPGVATVTPMPCNNGTTTTIQITLQNPINQNCNYTINSTLFRYDNCDSAYKFQNIINTFSIASCPIQASLNVSPINTVCINSCSANVAIANPATVCLTYNYNWNPPLPPTPGPHAVCPTVTTVYTCTLTEVTTSAQTIVTNTIYVLDPQINPIANPTVCQGSNFNFTASPPGGFWLGPGITNSVTGFFCSGCTTAGVKTVTYQIGNCIATITVQVDPMNPGSTDAACVGNPTFQVSGGTPFGGTWYGDPHITPSGIFTPTAAGAYTVYYTVNTCTSLAKIINVTNSVTVPIVPIDICKSQWWTRFSNGYGIQPFGGRYSKIGPGITNNVLGTFSPSIAGPGPHVITYSLAGGCSATFAVNVLDIDVSPTTATTCPSHIPFIPTATAIPAGGSWSCSIAGAIQNTATGLYNPSAGGVNSHTDILVYKATNGCPDTLVMRAIRTNMNRDTVFFCANSANLQLSNNLVNFSYTPTGGVYSGTGVSLAGPNYFFNPSVAGPGIHTVYYDAYTCRDSVKMVVYPTALTVTDKTICSTHPPFIVEQLPIGVTWSGNGITNPSTGLFNPASVAPGTYTVGFTSKAPLTCNDNISITVYQFVASDIANLNTIYCFNNTNIPFTTVPPNGTLTAPATVTNNIFNPAAVGSGTYMLLYTFGEGACHTRDSITIRIYPQLTTTTSITKDSVCLGEASKLTVNASGGLPTVTNYTHTWSNGLIPMFSHNVIPTTTTLYTVVTTDGCSDPVIDSFLVVVSPQYYPAFATTSIQCYGENGTATINITPSGGNYSYSWNTNPVQTTSVLTGKAGKSYIVRIVNTETGCVKDTSIKIPGYNAIKSLFSPNPNLSCIPFNDNLVSFIDLSNGAINGTWSFGGVTKPYTPGQTIQHEFTQAGTYNVILTVSNEGNCTDQYTIPICILESTEIFLPDIFSPNKDGANDELFVRGGGIKEISFVLYDRWGTKVFETNDVKQGWDGTFKGKDAEPGIYAYFLNVTMLDDKKIIQKGEITLVR